VRETEPRLTLVTRDVLEALLRLDGTERCYGNALAEEAGRSTGTVYPILQRMARCGWLVATREAEDPATLRRPQRVMYALTDLGWRVAEVGQATAILATTTMALRRVLVGRLVKLVGPTEEGSGRVSSVWHDAHRVVVCLLSGRELVVVDQERGVDLDRWEIHALQRRADEPSGPTHGTSP